MASRRIRIGYALAQKKIHSFIRPSLISHARERGIDLVQIDPSKPLSDQGPFHCIIHKLTDEEWYTQLQDYATRHPSVAVIDSPDAIERLHSRVTMLEVVEGINVESVGVPRQVFVETPQWLGEMKSVDFQFPVIVKPLVADGSADSHKMFLVMNEQGLKELELKLNPPFVVQEFVNHGGVLFKIYIAGKHVRCEKRKSLPDVNMEAVSENVLPFSHISNKAAEDESTEQLLKKVELPPSSFVEEVAKKMKEALKLNLFNFDVIRSINGDGNDRFLVIDINYFPGYAKVPSYEEMMTDFFMDVVGLGGSEDCGESLCKIEAGKT